MAKKEDTLIQSSVQDFINKKHGKGSSILLSDKPEPEVRLPSGSMLLDNGLGGGYPWGRMIEAFGPESSGKSTLAIHAVAEAQKLGVACAYIDMEQAFDAMYAQNLAVDINKLLFSQPEYGEQALSICEDYLKLGIKFIVVDSVATLIPKAELDCEMGESKMGLHARLMSQALRKLSPLCNQQNAIIFWVNQTREKIGVVYGSPETTTGGNALKFYASIRMRVSRVNPKADSTFQATQVAIIKNKTAPPFKKVTLSIGYGIGIELNKEIAALAVEYGVIIKKGSWYSYNGENLAQGEEQLCEWIDQNPDFIDYIKKYKIEE